LPFGTFTKEDHAMKRGVLCILVLTLVFAASATLASAQATPQFQLGFKALADQLPAVVGLPMENEHWGANGDSLQQTSAGLMVWRKADNWTAFTNGSRTWINGPLGVQERGNLERFDWETVLVPPSQPTQTPVPPSAPPASVTPTPIAPPADSVAWFIDKPVAGQSVSGQFTVTGWAADTAGFNLPYCGIDEFQVYADARMESGGSRVDVQSRRSARPDVATANSSAAYVNSGFDITVDASRMALGEHALYVYARSRLSGWRSKSIYINVAQPSISRARTEGATLRLSDMATGYHTKSYGWTSETDFEAQYEAGNYPFGQTIWLWLYWRPNGADAQSMMETFSTAALRRGEEQLPVSLSRADTARSYSSIWFLMGSDTGTTNGVFFRVSNVFGIVTVMGPSSVSHMDQATRLAQLVVNRLTAP
jgi:hypothetical protein